jgi:DNA mismatch repair ATPase MutS
MDKTKTKFGKRLLRKWVMSPLMNEYHINQRLDAIDDFYKIMLEK